MPNYVDGYVLPVPTKNLDAYRKMAQRAGKIWRKHGALAYVEAAGDDMNPEMCPGFKKFVKTKPGETIVFSYVVFKSRAHRDKVNAKVMKDPGLMEGIDMKNMPFDHKRMMYGGFKPLVQL
jgi:uncharacterized protein YbaA (DUF1428 family)